MPKKQLTGRVVSAKTDKTITVEVEKTRRHPKYEKRYIRHKNYYVHDAEGKAKEGDIVAIEETRPLSKTKRWRLLEIIEKPGLKE